MEKLRIQITSPQPVAKKERKRVFESCDWPVGAVIAYRLICGNPEPMLSMVDAFAQSGQSLRGQRADSTPSALELIHIRDEREHFGGDRQCRRGREHGHFQGYL